MTRIDTKFTAFCLAAAVSHAPLAASAEPLTSCKPANTDDPLQYQCVLQLDKNLDASEGQVKITMPSMPMAHSVPPSALAAHSDMADTYSFELKLDMFGEWMLTFDLEGERFNQKLMFMDGMPVSSDGAAMADMMNHDSHDTHKHDH